MSEQQHPLNALPQGHRLQEYELVRVLGFGGFGMTYLGFDHHLDKAVAIKEYLPSDIATRTADRSVAPQASDFRGEGRRARCRPPRLSDRPPCLPEGRAAPSVSRWSLGRCRKRDSS